MPYNSSGGEGEQANVTRAFAAVLADAVFPRPVFLWDESFSSTVASMRMNDGRGAARGERLDAVAAAVILEDFFNAKDDECAAAPYIASSYGILDPSAPRSSPPPSLPTPPSQAEVRREMMARTAREQAALDTAAGGRKAKGGRRGAKGVREAVAPPQEQGGGPSGGSGGSASKARAKRTAERSVDRYSID